MFDAWLCIPSARGPESTVSIWKELGYGVALWRDPGAVPVDCDFLVEAEYPGYASAVNQLIREVMGIDPTCNWVIAAGDDTTPDPTLTPGEIAVQLTEHFAGTFGVCQFTADRWGINPKAHAFVPLTPGCEECYCRQCGRGKIAPIHLTGAYIDRVAGSPWIGREFARRMYQGTGPYFPGYEHMYVDEELQLVAQKLGVFWQRPDLTHRHNHWGRGGNDTEILSDPKIPEHLEKWNTAEHWRESKALFTSRKAAGFPGYEPL